MYSSFLTQINYGLKNNKKKQQPKRGTFLITRKSTIFELYMDRG